MAWFENNVIATVPHYLSGRRAEGLSGLPAARRLHDHEPWRPPRQPLGDVQASGRRRRGKRRRDQGVLRRISLGLRHDRGILPPDRRRRVPAPPAAQGQDTCTAAAGSIRRRSATPRCWRSRASATTFPASARPRPRSSLAPALPLAKKRYYLAEDVGHYGIFNGRKWREKIAPVVEDWIARHD